jgi:hypothetical protein
MGIRIQLIRKDTHSNRDVVEYGERQWQQGTQAWTGDQLDRRIAGFPAAARIAIKARVDAITLAPVDDFRRDSDLCK